MRTTRVERQDRPGTRHDNRVGSGRREVGLEITAAARRPGARQLRLHPLGVVGELVTGACNAAETAAPAGSPATDSWSMSTVPTPPLTIWWDLVSRTEGLPAASGVVVVETGAIGDADADAVGCEADVVVGDAETADGAALPETAEATALVAIDAVGFGEPPPQATTIVAVSPIATADAERFTTARSGVGTGLLFVGSSSFPKTPRSTTQLRGRDPLPEVVILDDGSAGTYRDRTTANPDGGYRAASMRRSGMYACAGSVDGEGTAVRSGMRGSATRKAFAMATSACSGVRRLHRNRRHIYGRRAAVFHGNNRATSCRHRPVAKVVRCDHHQL